MLWYFDGVNEAIDGFQLTKQPDFMPILELIRQARTRTLSAINHELIDLYWQIGKYLSRKNCVRWLGARHGKRVSKMR